MSIVETTVPPLVAGDMLTLDEFLRRWEAMPDVKHAELIEGVVYMPSPVGPDHGDVDATLGGWLTVYALSTPGCRPSSNTTTILRGSAPQPDLHLRLLPEVGGRTRAGKNSLRGAPEFVAEVCVSRTSYDLNRKLRLYEEGKVHEYLAVLMQEEEVRWHRLTRGKFRRIRPDREGVFRSKRFPGLWLNGPALLARDLAGVMTTLNEGLASAEHEAFARELERKLSS